MNKPANAEPHPGNETVDPAQIQSYLNDIREIKSLLRSNEQKPLVPAWAFFIWAGLIVVGTGAHLGLFLAGSPLVTKVLWLVWLPVLLLGSVFESAGFLQIFRRQQPVLLSPKVLQTYAGLIGLWLSFSAILVYLFFKGQLTGGLVLCILSACYMLIAQLSYHKLLLPGFLLLVAGLVLLVLDWSGMAAIALTGLVCALGFAVGGWITQASRKHSGQHSHE